MKLLIDTHVFIWVTTNSNLMSKRAAALLADADNEIHLSAVSAYEIEFKRPRDVELQRMPPDLSETLAFMGFHWLPVTWEHASLAARLPLHHRDPWDRILIAQSIVEDARLVSIDRQFSGYGVPLLW